MAISLSDWQQLIEARFEPSIERVRAVEDREEQKRLDGLMWKAINDGQLDALRQAISNGARLKAKQQGRPPLWWAVRLERWDMAQYLIEAGADPNFKTQGGNTLWGAISHRDSPREADRLVDLGFNPSNASFLQDMQDPTKNTVSHALFEWWLENGYGQVPQSPSVRVDLLLKMGAAGSPRLREILNQSWEFDGKDPSQFPLSNKKDGYADRFWEDVLAKNNVPLLQELLKSGWGFWGNTPSRGYNPMWDAANRGAWDVFDWLCTNDTFKQIALASAAENPSNTWWRAVSSSAALERFIDIGIDIEQVNFRGDNVAHYMATQDPIKKSVFTWIMQQHPQLLEARDDKQKTPLDYLKPGEWADLSSVIIKRNTKKAAPHAPAQVRRI